MTAEVEADDNDGGTCQGQSDHKPEVREANNSV